MSVFVFVCVLVCVFRFIVEAFNHFFVSCVVPMSIYPCLCVYACVCVRVFFCCFFGGGDFPSDNIECAKLS